MERLDKILSTELNITRSEAKALIKRGSVRVNGSVVLSPDFKAGESDLLLANGKEITPRRFVYIMMNKPKGVISSTDGKKTNEKTVLDILPDEMKRKNLFPAGRLDKDTTGFVLITDDGEFAHDILSPKKHIPKTYAVTLDAPFDNETVAAFERGVVLDTEKCLPAELSPLNEEKTMALVTIRQGMYHQIKRMFKKYSLHVLELKRVKMGGLALDESLSPGEARYINEDELTLIGLN